MTVRAIRGAIQIDRDDALLMKEAVSHHESQLVGRQ